MGAYDVIIGRMKGKKGNKKAYYDFIWFIQMIYLNIGAYAVIIGWMKSKKGNKKSILWLHLGPYAPQGSRKLQKWSRRSKSVLPTF